VTAGPAPVSGASSSVAAEVPFVDLRPQHERLAPELGAAFERVLDASAFILGEEVERFEEEFAAYCGVPHCVGVSSGTAALTLGLIAAGIGAGDEVIVPAHTYIASALGVLHTGATPVFCDVDRETGLIDLDSAAAAASPRTAALLAVHLYGQVCDMDAIASLAARHGIAVFEDAAQAHGARWGGRPAGSFGLAAGFSFYPSKNLGALGDGGAVCTADTDLADRVRQLRDIGQRGKGEHVVAGYNERLDGLQAALLRVKLPHLDGWNDERRRIAALYRSRLDGRVPLLPERGAETNVHHIFPVRAPERDEVAHRLGREGIRTGVHYSPCVPDQPPFASAGGGVECANARTWAAEELSLPMYPGLPDAAAELTANSLRELRVRR
jgi:dTDP-3-amino-3,4,6-trideoxy-alpha-D-glucose transaminase